MELIRDSVIKSLYDFPAKDDRLISELNQIISTHGRQTYSVILHVLTHLELEPVKAEECWNRILTHRKSLSDTIGRDISLRTAMCDYFQSIDRTLKNPIVIEIQIFEATANSSKFDSLTGLYSKGFFDSALEREIARAKRYKTDLSILFFDLDNFKGVNDTYGHLTGDMVLKRVSRVVIEETRSEDTPARFGGEEIVLILPETGKVQSLVAGERIRKKIEALKMTHDKQPINLTVSGGLATYPIDAKNPIKLMQCADNALYNAKRSGKNNIAFYSKDKRHSNRIDFKTEIKIRKINLDDLRDFTGIGKNISITGMRFESANSLEMGSKVQLQIPVSTKESPVSVIGSVVRVEKINDGQYDISVSFVDIEKTTMDKLNKLFTES
jgi:diguanylate cyclase (GGDEF)-like protein